MTTSERILNQFDRDVKKARRLLESLLAMLEDDELDKYLQTEFTGISKIETELSFREAVEQNEEDEDKISEILGQENFGGQGNYFIDLTPD